MSLHPEEIGPIPEQTVRIACAAFPKGNVYMKIRDELGPIYTDQQFTHLFPRRGQPAEAPWRLLLVTAMQFMEGLTDRQAADAVRGRLEWKYLLGLELEDPGFHYSVLSEFRDRLIAGQAEMQLLEILLERLRAKGLLKARGQQRTDSTHVLAAVRVTNRLESVGETMRACLNAIAVVAPEWLRARAEEHWYELYGARIEEARFPRELSKRQALARQIGADGYELMALVYAPDAPEYLAQLPAVEILRQMWVYQYYRSPATDKGRQDQELEDQELEDQELEDQELEVHFREADNLAPATKRFDSPYDPEALYSTKRSTTWTGYKVHVTETCDDDQVHVITHIETSLSPEQDVQANSGIHQALDKKGLLPKTHFMDAGYVDASFIVESQQSYGVEVVGPVRYDSSPQARAKNGYDISHFQIDWEEQKATCPNGKVSVKWRPGKDRWDNPQVHIDFSRTDCLNCPDHSLCTRSASRPRHIGLRTQAEHMTLQEMRIKQQTKEWKERYQRRAGVEGTISQGIRGFELRQCRYIGIKKTHLQHVATAVAINLTRVAAWMFGTPHAPTRISRFAALAA